MGFPNIELFHNELELREDTVKTVKKIMLLETADEVRLYGKTGTGRLNKTTWLGWVVGFVENEKNVYFYAINLQQGNISFSRFQERRKSILRKAFNHLDIQIPPGP